MKENILEKDSPMMETPIELIEAARAKVKAILEAHFPDFLEFDDGALTITRGSTTVMIIIRPFTNNETCIEFIANVVIGADVNCELMQFLLRKNAELHFGSFGLLFDDTITFSHSIAGTNLDANELKVTLNSVAVIADYYDDVIVDMAGGSRASDYNSEDLESN